MVLKNFKNLFRNPASIFVMIIGPLSVIGVIILAFASPSFHNIDVGVVGPSEALQPIKLQISHVGEFHEDENLEECIEMLKLQRRHLCIDVHLENQVLVDLYYDNTREVISFILLNQAREGVLRERENLLKTETSGLVSEARGAKSYVQEKRILLSEAVDEMKGYRTEIIQIQREIDDTVLNLNRHITDLEFERNRLASTSSSTSEGYWTASNTVKSIISEFSNDIEDARDILIEGGMQTYEIDNLVPQVDDLEDSIQELDDQANTLQADVDEVIRKMDDALVSMREARTFLRQTKTDLQDISYKLDERIIQLENVNVDLAGTQEELALIGNVDVNLLLNPFVLRNHAVFTGSDKVKRLAEEFDGEVTSETADIIASIGSTQTMLPKVMILILSFVALFISNIIVLDEKESPAYIRNMITPVWWFWNVLSIIVTISALLSIQIAVLLAIGALVFLLDITAAFFTIAAVSLLIAIIYGNLGIALGYLSKSPATSLLVAVFFLIINIFMSGMTFPVERMSPFMYNLSLLIPYRDGISMLQQSMFYGIGLFEMMPELTRLSMLWAISVVFLIVAHHINRKRV